LLHGAAQLLTDPEPVLPKPPRLIDDGVDECDGDEEEPPELKVR
jgi:hypothetical protein